MLERLEMLEKPNRLRTSPADAVPLPSWERLGEVCFGISGFSSILEGEVC
jgi:hypothetical protein